MWIFGFFWIVFTSLAIWGVRQVPSRNLPPLWFFGIFYSFGLVMLLIAGYVTMSRVRYGRSVLELQTLGCTPGGVMTGAIRIPRPLIYRDSIHLRLACIRSAVQRTLAWNHGVQEEDVLWEDQCTMDRFSSGARVGQVLVSFRIPPAALPCCEPKGGQQILWRLEVKAKTAGLPYVASFLVPVLDQAPIGDRSKAFT
jgi:hypothetical protein